MSEENRNEDENDIKDPNQIEEYLREKEEQDEQDNPIANWFVGMFWFTVIFLSVLAFLYYTTGFVL